MLFEKGSVIKRPIDSTTGITSWQADTTGGQTSTESGQTSTTNKQTNEQTSTTSGKTSTTSGQASIMIDKMSFASTTSDKTGSAIIITLN